MTERFTERTDANSWIETKGRENFVIADIKIQDPHLEKGMMLVFNADGSLDKEVLNACSRAIREVMKDYKVFHQLDSADQEGIQGWELWQNASKEEVEAKLSEVHVRAKELYSQAI